MSGKDHANLLGVFAYVFAGIQSLITLFIGMYALMMGGFGVLIAIDGKPGDIGGVMMMFVFAAIFGLFFTLGLVSIIMNVKMGRRLRSDRPPSKRSVMIMSIMNCAALLSGGMFSMPLGAAIGGYGIWFAASDVGERYLEGIPEPQPSYIDQPTVRPYTQEYTQYSEPYKWR